MKRILFFTGAGISAESGISTFRDSDGLWENHKIEEVCNWNTWKKHRELVFNFYNQRRVQLNTTEPNLIHKKIAEMQEEFSKLEEPVEIVIITQNVDNLLEKAGCKNVIHVHGELNKMLCTHCGTNWEIDLVEIDHTTVRCPKCDSNKSVKPGIVFFGEEAPNYRLLKRELKQLNSEDFLIIMGTMGNVVSIDREAEVHPGYAILNNLEPSPYFRKSNYDHIFYKPGTEAILDIEIILKRKLNLIKD